MSGTIPYNFNPQQTVWVITTCNSNFMVRQGLIIRVQGTKLGSPTTVTYDIQLLGDNGTTLFNEIDVFVDLATATTEYQLRLTI